jgi:predicted esterase
MARRWVPWVAAAGAAAAGLGAAGIAYAFGGPDCSGVGEDGGTAEGVRYLERMRGGASSSERVPMVVLLHARDATPEGYASGMNGIGRARLIVPEGGFESPIHGYMWFPAGLKATLEGGFDNAESHAWAQHAERLARLVKTLARCRPTLGKPIITGASSGGEMTLVMATQHRRLLGGAVAVNGDMPSGLWRPNMAPTVMLNGTRDTTIPFAAAQQNAAWAAERGAPVSFEAFTSSGHDLTGAQTKAWRDRVEAFVAQQA